ncbi:fimbrillin family protein [Parabacteroides sp. GYB001]|uniref:fimbrillin family protein n=1 Tax=Parabacteroides leei TaxID=2939491 RepID=UPI00201782CA|nr:fimbrillin family protein [Parabacteroides leei]MCL3850362.1 fimbrillin family protein [Parabacteroides leei]
MKQIIYNACALLAVCLSGCSMVETNEIDNGGALVALGVTNASLETKSVYTDVSAGTTGNVLNKIGVGVTRENNASWYDTNAVKQQFTAKAGTPLTWEVVGDPLYLNDTDGTVYAWAPSTQEATLTAGSAPKLSGVTFAAAQTFDFTDQGGVTDWNTSETDYLYSDPVTKINKNNSSAALNMKHALSKVSFRVMKAKGFPAPGDRDYVKEVKLTFKADGGKTGFTGKGDIALNTGNLTASDEGRLATVTLTPKEITASRQVAAYKETGSNADFTSVLPQAFALVAPCGLADKGKLDVSVKVGTKDEATYDRTFTTTTSTDLDWAKGNHYIYTILLTEKALTISSVTLVGWTDNLKDPVAAE